MGASSRARVIALRTVGIVLFVAGVIVALFDVAGDHFSGPDLVFVGALVVAAAGAALGVRFRKRRPHVTVANVLWRVAPLVGIATGILYILIFFSAPVSSDEPSFLGASVFAFSGVGLVWGVLCALGAVVAWVVVARTVSNNSLPLRLGAIVLGSLVGCVAADVVTARFLSGALTYFAFGLIITVAVATTLLIGYRDELVARKK